MNKKRNTIIISLIIGSILILVTILLAIIFNNNTPSKENSYEGFENTIVISDKLDYILSEDFDKYTLNIIEKSLNDYFMPLYPSGAGIGYASYRNTNKEYSLRIIDSYGVFHTFIIQKEDLNVMIEIDDFKKTYTIEMPNREEGD